MKPKRLTIISLVLLATIIAGTGAIIAFSADYIKANVKWDPKSYGWDGTPPDPWYAQIWLTGGHKRYEINTTTIRLEGMYSPSAPPYPAAHGPRLIVPFSGWDVKTAIDAKLPYNHIGVLLPGRYKIELEITGNLLPEYDGTSFRGIGTVTVTVPESGG